MRACIIAVPDAHTEHRAEVLRLVAAHGGANANIFTTFANPEMELLLLPGVGCMPYTAARAWGRGVMAAVGDPVCAPQHTSTMLGAFVAAFPHRAAFFDLSRGAAASLAALDSSLAINDIGAETVVDVQRYDLEFNKKTKHIRRRADSAAAAGLVVSEVTAGASPAVKAQVQQMAQEW
jgi:class 3 adenylate cyclase